MISSFNNILIVNGIKKMTSRFWDSGGTMFIDYLLNAYLLRYLRNGIKRKRSECMAKDVLLHHDNPAHHSSSSFIGHCV